MTSKFFKPKGLVVVCVLALSVSAIPTGYLLLKLMRPQPVMVGPPPQATIVMQGKAMGSTYVLRYVGGSTASFPSPVKVQAMVNDVLNKIDSEISTWNPDSQLSQFNASRSSDWIEVAPAIVDMVRSTAELTELSKGKFDITVGPLVDAWGFGPRGRVSQQPTTQTLRELLDHVGFAKLQSRTDPPALRKLDANVAIDLSAIGAGEAADRIAAQLRALGIDNFFLDVTGETIAAGVRADGQPWQVAIARPELDSRKTVATLPLLDGSLATSGNYRNAVRFDDAQFGHTIDATIGWPLQTDILSVSVLDNSCRRADGLATALMTMTAVEALRAADERGWRVVIVRAAAEPRDPASLAAALRKTDAGMETLWSRSAAQDLNTADSTDNARDSN